MKKEIILGIDLGVNCGIKASTNFDTLESIRSWIEDEDGNLKDINDNWSEVMRWINCGASRIKEWCEPLDTIIFCDIYYR